MKNRIVIVALLIAGVASPISTNCYGRWYAGRRVGVGYGVGYGMANYAAAYGGYGYGGVGTVYSAQENARANTIRAQGEYNQMNTAAMKNYEEARSTYIDNQQKWTQVYLERQRAAAELRSANQAEAQARAERVKEFNAAHPPTGPARLASNQLDPSTGHIEWPTALTAVAFESQRKTLESLFALRTHASTNADLATQVEKAVTELKTALREKIRDIPAQDYMEARRFLDGLVVEGRSPVG